MKILVTGGAGFIGSHLCENLLNTGHDVVVIDDLSTGLLTNLDNVMHQVCFFKSRVEDFDLYKLGRIDAVAHLAAQASVPVSISDFYNSSKTNLMNNIKVLDFCSNNKIPLVYASSSAIYGGIELGEDENTKFDLLSPYSVDKFVMELYAEVLNKTHGLSSIGLRLFNVYGPRQDPNNPYSGVVPVFLRNILSEENIIINGGSQTRDFIYVDDVVEIINIAITKCMTDICNISVNVLTGRSVSIDWLADTLISLSNRTATKVYNELPIGDPLVSNGTLSVLKRLVGDNLHKFTKLEDGLEYTLSSMLLGEKIIE